MEKVVAMFDKPADCFDCPCCDGDQGYCQLLGKSISDYAFEDVAPEDCPLVSVDSIINAMKDGIREGIEEAIKNEMS